MFKCLKQEAADCFKCLRLPSFILSSLLSIMQIYKGSFAGTPAFLGYFPGVFFILSIFTNVLPMSVSGSITA